MKKTIILLLILLLIPFILKAQKDFPTGINVGKTAQFNGDVKLSKLTHQSSPNSIPILDSITKIITGYVPINTSKTFTIDTITSNIVTINAVLNVTGNVTIVQLQGSLTDGAPTNAQIVAIIGKTAAQSGAGYTVTIKDTDGTGLLYRIESDGTSYFYHVTTKAL